MLHLTLAILAQSDPSSIPDSPLEWITSGGIVGVLSFMLIAFLREWVYVGSTVRKRLEEKDKEIDELKQETREMTLFLREQVMPAITRSNDFAATLAEQKALEDRDRMMRRTQNQPLRRSSDTDAS